MPGWIADYRVLADQDPDPAGPPPERVIVEAPERLGRGAVPLVLHVAVEPGAPWAAFVDYVRVWAGLHAPTLVELLEAGVDRNPARRVGYVAASPPDPTHPAAAGLDADDALRAVAGAARGAHELHEAGVVHGRIGPASILVTPDGGCLDLPPYDADGRAGLVARLSAPDAADAVDPDRARGEAASRATDIWALGASLHRLLTGAALHPGIEDDPPLTVVQRIATEPPRLADDLSGPQLEVLRSCLSPDPGERPATAAELADRVGALVVAP